MTVLTQTEKEITAPEEITDIEERKIESFVQGKPCSQKINAKTVDSIRSKTQKSSNLLLDKLRSKKTQPLRIFGYYRPRKNELRLVKIMVPKVLNDIQPINFSAYVKLKTMASCM